MQTSDSRLRKKALTEGTDYNTLVKLGCTLESTDSQANEMNVSEKVRNLKSKSNKKTTCSRCGYFKEWAHKKGQCPAIGQKCAVCKEVGHFAKSKTCSGIKKKVRSIPTDETGSHGDNSDTESDEEIGRVLIAALTKGSDEELVSIFINGKKTTKRVDSGCKKTLIGISEFKQLKLNVKLLRTNVKFTPYGTNVSLKIKGRVKVNLCADNGANVETWIYVVDDKVESLLGANDAKALGILIINPGGSKNVTVNSTKDISSSVEQIITDFDQLFHGIGSFKGEEINFKIDDDVVPVVQRYRPTALAYRERLDKHLDELLENDVIEGPLGSYANLEWMSNPVIDTKKVATKFV